MTGAVAFECPLALKVALLYEQGDPVAPGCPFPPHTALRALQSPSHANFIPRVKDMAPPLTPAKWHAGNVLQDHTASGVCERGRVAY